MTSDKENIEKYTQLTNPDIYDIGDSNRGTLLESNYNQYDWTVEYDIIEKTLEKYENTINIKLGMINYGCLEKLENKNTVVDEDGNVIERKESTIEEALKYQSNEFDTNLSDYYGNEEFNENLYFKITGMLLMNGNNLTEKDYYNNARAKKLRLLLMEKLRK